MKSFNYGAYGDVIGEEGSIMQAGPGFDSSMPEVFASAYGIRRDTTTGLDYMRFRWYAKDLSSFISADRVRGTNRYAYAKGNPVKYVDPMGLKDRGFPNVYNSPYYHAQFIKPDGSHPVWGTSAPPDRPASAYHHPDYGHSISDYCYDLDQDATVTGVVIVFIGMEVVRTRDCKEHNYLYLQWPTPELMIYRGDVYNFKHKNRYEGPFGVVSASSGIIKIQIADGGIGNPASTTIGIGISPPGIQYGLQIYALIEGDGFGIVPAPFDNNNNPGQVYFDIFHGNQIYHY